MQLFLIRHGQSQNNALPESQRVHDPSITDLGRIQAARVAHRLATMNIDRLLVSPFRRTLETLWPTYQRLALPTCVWVDIHERGGCYRGHTLANMAGMPGMSRDEIAADFPGLEIPTAVDETGWWKSDQRETDREAEARVAGVIRSLIADHGDSSQRLAVFTHADFKTIFVSQVIRPPEARIDVAANGSISEFRVAKGHVELVTFNQVDHLQENEISF